MIPRHAAIAIGVIAILTGACSHQTVQTGRARTTLSFVATADICEGNKIVQGACFDVSGELQIWNGWPPWLRLESGNKLYGIGPEDKAIMPNGLTDWLVEQGATHGRARLCPLGYSDSVPYLKKPIPINCLERFVPGK